MYPVIFFLSNWTEHDCINIFRFVMEPGSRTGILSCLDICRPNLPSFPQKWSETFITSNSAECSETCVCVNETSDIFFLLNKSLINSFPRLVQFFLLLRPNCILKIFKNATWYFCNEK